VGTAGTPEAKETETNQITDRIGVILVHGIGDHRRFEHLDGELRPLISALARRGEPAAPSHDAPPRVTVEIIEGSASTLHADQDTWGTEAGSPVRVIVEDNGVKKQINFHEVWWADVNEPYSLWKQIKFWSWGLSVWLVPAEQRPELEGATKTMVLPSFPNWLVENRFVLRLRLFFVCNVFAMAAFSLGAIIFFAKRLLGFQAPSIVKIFVNYIGAVKLYSQRRRSDGGFLDAYLEPPRVSIRRRMIRVIADVALARYDRWYVFAHSLGSVVAFNGLMENAYAIPNYLSHKQFRQLEEKVDGKPNTELAGPHRADDVVTTGRMLPARPLWLSKDDVAYRDRLFERFRGLLTYGSPLDKFAAIWPSRVPINVTEPGLPGGVVNGGPERARPAAEWINVYDPTDPVAAHLDAFEPTVDKEGAPLKEGVLFAPRNYAYAAYWALLLSHLHYFDGKHGKKDRLADCLMEWILSGHPFRAVTDQSGLLWLDGHPFLRTCRHFSAWAMWIAAYLLLTFLGALSLPLWKSLLIEGGGALAAKVHQIWNEFFTYRETFDLHVFDGVTSAIAGWAAAIGEWISDHGGRWIWDAIACIGSWIAWAFFGVFGLEGLITAMSLYLGLPAVVEEMIKLSLGVMIFVLGAGIVAWLRLLYQASNASADSVATVTKVPDDAGKLSEQRSPAH